MNTVILSGNPNCGKTTLYNRLCLKSEPVGNRAGVTVTAKRATLRRGYGHAAVADLPGMYSLSGGGKDETNAAKFIAENDGVIIDVIDAADIGRGLMLYCELRQTGHTVIIALNMIDEAKKRGTKIDIPMLERLTRTRVFPICASRGDGVKALISYAVECGMKSEAGAPMTAEERINFGENAVKAAVKYGKPRTIDEKIDGIICRPAVGIPLLFAVTAVIIALSFSTVGGFLSDKLTELFDVISSSLKSSLLSAGCGQIAAGLLCDGAIGGIGAVCSFLPQSAIMFILLEALDDIGYLSRAAFVTDGFMRRFGMDGKAFIPLILGMGCTVPAVITADALPESERRKVTVSAMFIPCGARFTVMLFVLKSVCGKYTAAAVFSFYILCFAAAFIYSALSKGNKAEPTITELTRYRMPTARNLIRSASGKLLDFISRAASTVVACSVVVYILSHLNICMQYCDIESSILYAAVGYIAPIMRPLGLSDAGICSALVCGALAKEAIISALTVTGYDISSLGLARAVSLCAFSLLYCPCAAAFSAVTSRHGIRFAVKTLLICLCVAYAVAFIFYNGFSVYVDF